MFLTLNGVFLWLSHYKYFVIFPLSIVEGPILAVLSGFLSSVGQLDFLIAYILLVIGDTIGDSCLYLLGRYGNGRIPDFLLRLIGIDQKKVYIIGRIMKKYPKRIFSMGKVLHGVGSVVLFTAGYVDYPFGKYIFYNTAMTMVKTFLLMLMGFYFGRAYNSINHYFDYWAIFSGIVFILVYIVFLKYGQKYADEFTE